jgi:hypothetical protein
MGNANDGKSDFTKYTPPPASTKQNGTSGHGEMQRESANQINDFVDNVNWVLADVGRPVETFFKSNRCTFCFPENEVNFEHDTTMEEARKNQKKQAGMTSQYQKAQDRINRARKAFGPKTQQQLWDEKGDHKNPSEQQHDLEQQHAEPV